MTSQSALLAAVILAAALPSMARAQTSLIKIDGSSTVYPVTEAVAEEFQTKFGVTKKLFSTPENKLTEEYITGRFG